MSTLYEHTFPAGTLADCDRNITTVPLMIRFGEIYGQPHNRTLHYELCDEQNQTIVIGELPVNADINGVGSMDKLSPHIGQWPDDIAANEIRRLVFTLKGTRAKLAHLLRQMTEEESTAWLPS